MTDNNEIAGQDLDYLLPFSTPNNYPPKPLRLDAQTQITLRGYLNIYQRINEIKKHCDTVQVDVEQEGKNWSGVSLNAVMQLVRNKMIAHGVFSRITLVESWLDPVSAVGEESQIGFNNWIYKGIYCVRFINIDSPVDCVELRVEGVSVGDNAGLLSSWAESQAFKRAFIKTFNIIMVENEEPLRVREIEKISEIASEFPASFGEVLNYENISFDQINALSVALKKKGVTEERLCETFEINELSDMRIHNYKKAIELIEKM